MTVCFMMFLKLVVVGCLLAYCYGYVRTAKMATRLRRLPLLSTVTTAAPSVPKFSLNTVTPKTVTKEIMDFFAQPRTEANDVIFSKRLIEPSLQSNMDGLHALTILFQCARTRRRLKSIISVDVLYSMLEKWDRVWSERDISTFAYGLASLECTSEAEVKLLSLGAMKISQSNAMLSSRSIGNALYGLREISSDIKGVAEVCQALALKIRDFEGDLTGQDIGIGLYGLQGMSANVPEVRTLVDTLATKIRQSDSELDTQAISNALYGLQSLSSDYPEVLSLLSSLSAKISESPSSLCPPQAMGAALYGLQRMASDSVYVREVVSALAEKVMSMDCGVDAQSVSNALFGLQRMRSNSVEVRNLVSALAKQISGMQDTMSGKDIATALYGLHNMAGESPQVQSLLRALAEQIKKSKSVLTGTEISDCLYGLQNMSPPSPALSSLLATLSDKIGGQGEGSDQGFTGREMANALWGLGGIWSGEGAADKDVAGGVSKEVRLIAKKIGERISLAPPPLTPQLLSKTLSSLYKMGGKYPETQRIYRSIVQSIYLSPRTILSPPLLSEALWGLQSLNSNNPESQVLLGAVAGVVGRSPSGGKGSVRNTAQAKLDQSSGENAWFGEEMTSMQLGRALYGLGGCVTSAPAVPDSALLLDNDETVYLVSCIWDKVKVRRGGMSLGGIGVGLMGMVNLKDPIAAQIKAYLYMQLMKIGEKLEKDGLVSDDEVILAIRALVLNSLRPPPFLLQRYQPLEKEHPLVLSRREKIVIQKYMIAHPPSSANTMQASSSTQSPVRNPVSSSPSDPANLASLPTDQLLVNSLVDGFNLALNFPQLRLNVEFDGDDGRGLASLGSSSSGGASGGGVGWALEEGGDYPSKRRLQSLRDAYLSQAHAYKVVRIPLLKRAGNEDVYVERSAGEVVDDVYAVVQAEKEKTIEKYIQSIYARGSGGEGSNKPWKRK